MLMDARRVTDDCYPCLRIFLLPMFPTAHCRAISVSPLGLWVEPEDAQFLVAPTGLGDTRRPRDGLVARR